MKNKKIIYMIIGLISLGLTISLFYISNVNAESGWDYDYDYDYDSGSSWDYDYDSGSSYDYDSSSSWDYDDYDYDSGSNYNYGSNSSYSSRSHTSSMSNSQIFGMMTTLIVVTVIMISITLLLTNRLTRRRPIVSSNNINSSKYYAYQQVSSDEMSKLGMTHAEFNTMVFELYKNIQNAWMNFDYDGLRELVTDEIANSYIMQLDALKLKKQKNIMEDIQFVNAKVYNIREENGMFTIDIYLDIKMKDYVVDEFNNVIRGDKSFVADIEYELSVVKVSGNDQVTKCPACGAKLDMITTGKCPYCRTLITVDAKKYVMSRKTCINQRRG